MKKQLLLLVMLLLPMLASADDSGQCGDNVNYTYVEATHTLTISGSGRMYDYQYQWDDYNYEYGPNTPWRRYKNDILSVIILDGVKSIGQHAFGVCSGLTSVTIPNSVFEIGFGAFQNCSGLTSVTIPKSVTYIDFAVFSGCRGLTSITVENGNPNYDSRNNCNAIIKTATNALLYGCKNTIIPNSVTSIGYLAFSSCSALTSITIPNSVTSIGVRAFGFCSGLTSVTFPNSVTSIGDGAFERCRGLTSLTIPNSVTSIGKNAFEACSGLTSIIVENSNPKYDSRNNCNAIIETATNTLHTGCMNTVIPNSVTSIGEYAFYECIGLTSVTIPNRVTSIGEYAFCDCSGLTSMTIPNNVTAIGEKAFYFCSGLTSVTIGNSVISIGDYAFDGCSGLTSVTVGNSVTSIGEGAFSRCSDLTSITIPNSVTSIDNYAFSGCEGLEEVKTFIKKPFAINTNCWNYVKTEEIPLYVPKGTKALYEATEGWNVFKNIIEMDDNDIDPVDGDGSVNFSEDDGIDDDTDLDGNVIGNIYYVIGDDNGEYSSAEGCVIIRKPTSDEQVDNLSGQDLFGEDLKDNYTGIIFKVQAGSGTIKVNAESVGGMTLKVKIGNNAPFTMELVGKMKVTIPYTVTEPTYIYIYAGGSSASARGINRAGADSALKIYGFEWSQSSSDVNSIYTKANNSDDTVYNMNGQRLWTTPKQKGVYIVNGRKVLRP